MPFRFCISDTTSGSGILCPALGRVTNADINVACYNPGCQVSYTCQAGTEHVRGDLVRTCSTWGSWSGVPPVCQGKLHLFFRGGGGTGLGTDYCVSMHYL